MPQNAQVNQAKWEQFTRLEQTQDSMAQERGGLRRWMFLSLVTFVIPIDDPAVTAQLVTWQRAFRSWLQYEPQPAERLHITLHYAGGLRRHPWVLLPYTWRREALPRLADRVRGAIERLPAFDVRIGPLNAFPNVLYAEVQDGEDECLRMLRARLRRALPLRARPPTFWQFLPHITLGHWGEQPVAPLIEAIRPYREVEPLTLHVTRVKFTIYYMRRTLPVTPDMLVRAREEVIAEFFLKS